MKNDYKILGDTTIIYLKRRNGEVLETVISTSDLPKAKEFPNTWCVVWSKKTESFYVQGFLPRKDGVRKPAKLHRFILDAPKDKMVDHLNHDTLNNTRGNLRLVTRIENMQNRKGPIKGSTSGIRGVSWSKQANKWVAYVVVNKKQHHVGYFVDIKEAEKAVIEARKKHLPYATN